MGRRLRQAAQVFQEIVAPLVVVSYIAWNDMRLFDSLLVGVSLYVLSTAVLFYAAYRIFNGTFWEDRYV